MRKHLPGTLLAFILLIVLAGCAATPRGQWAQARETLTTAQDLIGTAHDSGQIGDEEVVNLDLVVQGARAALTQAETYLPEGGDDFNHYMGIVRAVLVRISAIEEDK